MPQGWRAHRVEEFSINQSSLDICAANSVICGFSVFRIDFVGRTDPCFMNLLNYELATGREAYFTAYRARQTGARHYQKHFARNNFIPASSLTSVAPSMIDCAASMRSNGSR